MSDLKLPLSMKARNVGFTEMLAALRRDFDNTDAPLPWWMKVHRKAVETHRAIDMQIVIPLERKRACPSSQSPS